LVKSESRPQLQTRHAKAIRIYPDSTIRAVGLGVGGFQLAVCGLPVAGCGWQLEAIVCLFSEESVDSEETCGLLR